MVKGVKREAIRLIEQAIVETGTTFPGAVSLRIEEIMAQRIKKMKRHDYATLFIILGRYGIKKYSDVVRLVDQVRRAV